MTSLLKNFSCLLDRFLVSIERYRAVYLLLFISTYLGITCYRASRKLFWFDELFTVHLARLGSPTELWRALVAGTDFNPVLMYALTWLFESILGQGHVGARMPQIVGFGIFCLCLYFFTARRTGTLGGLVALLFPLATAAYWYAYEARPHALVAMFCGIALISWQEATSREGSRLRSLLTLSCALGGALLSHAYGLLLFVPIVIGELVRLVNRKRPDWSLWLSILVATTPLLALAPLAAQASKTLPQSVFLPTIAALLETFRSLFAPATVVLAGAFVSLLFADLVGRARNVKEKEAIDIPPFELAALISLLALPVFAWVLALFLGSFYMDRYSISAVGGFACLLGIAAGRHPRAALVVAVLLTGQVGVDLLGFARGKWLTEPSTKIQLSTDQIGAVQRLGELLSMDKEARKVVLMDDLDFAPVFYYAPPEIGRRLVYVQWSRGDFNANGYRKLQACCGAPGELTHVSEFLALNGEFLLYGRIHHQPHVRALLGLGAEVRVVHFDSRDTLFRVTMKPKQ